MNLICVSYSVPSYQSQVKTGINNKILVTDLINWEITRLNCPPYKGNQLLLWYWIDWWMSLDAPKTYPQKIHSSIINLFNTFRSIMFSSNNGLNGHGEWCTPLNTIPTSVNLVILYRLKTFKKRLRNVENIVYQISRTPNRRVYNVHKDQNCSNYACKRTNCKDLASSWITFKVLTNAN